MKNPCKHFILIKEYPNSKPLGAIEPYTTGEFSNHPEFWKPIYQHEFQSEISEKNESDSDKCWREFKTIDNIYILPHWLSILNKSGVKPEYIKITDSAIFYFSGKKIL